MSEILLTCFSYFNDLEFTGWSFHIHLPPLVFFLPLWVGERGVILDFLLCLVKAFKKNISKNGASRLAAFWKGCLLQAEEAECVFYYCCIIILSNSIIFEGSLNFYLLALVAIDPNPSTLDS